MKLAWASTESRLPNAWILLLVALWGLAVSLPLLLGRVDVIVCNLRRLTGVPCPTCGSTRAVVALIHGDIVGAFVHNPLTIVFGATIGMVLGVRLGTRRVIRVEASGREWTLLAIGLLVVLGVNWVWVLRSHAML